jgi:8-amino-7-oxononanoate synthase
MQSDAKINSHAAPNVRISSNGVMKMSDQMTLLRAHNDRPANRFRNTAYVIQETSEHFDSAHMAGLMAVYCRSTQLREVALGRGPMRHRPRVIDFVRCSYLGLDNHPSIVAGAIAAIEAHGCVHWSCARTRLNFDLMGQLEETLSEMFGAHIIAFSTVMLANLGALPILASGRLTGGIKPVMVFDRTAHISLAYHKPVIADETRVVTIGHNDIEALEHICKTEAAVAYVCDGVYSMGGFAPIKELRRLQDKYGLFLYIDDAHGISLFGERGEGFARSQFPDVLGDRTIIAASLGKGFGASGGLLMLGTDEQDMLFRRYALPHAFSASPNLAAIGAALASAKIHCSPELGQRQKRLAARIKSFDEEVLTEQKGSALPIRMVTIGDEESAIAAAKAILDFGFYTSVTFFPTIARGKAGIRVCLTADHTLDDISILGELLRDAARNVEQQECPEIAPV